MSSCTSFRQAITESQGPQSGQTTPFSPGQQLSKEHLNPRPQQSAPTYRAQGAWAAIPADYLRTFKPTRQAGFDLSYIIRCWHKLSISGPEAGLAYNELLINRHRLPEYIYELTRAVDIQEQYFGSWERISALRDEFFHVLPEEKLLTNLAELQAHYQNIHKLTLLAREISQEPVYLPGLTRCSRSQFSKLRDSAPDLLRWGKIMALLKICDEKEFASYVQTVAAATKFSSGKLRLMIALGVEPLPEDSDSDGPRRLVELLDQKIVQCLKRLKIRPRRTQRETLAFIEFEWLQPSRAKDEEIVKVPLFSRELRKYIPTAPGYTPGVMPDRQHAIRKTLPAPVLWLADFYKQQTQGEYPIESSPSSPPPKTLASDQLIAGRDRKSSPKQVSSQQDLSKPSLSAQEYAAGMKDFRRRLSSKAQPSCDPNPQRNAELETETETVEKISLPEPQPCEPQQIRPKDSLLTQEPTILLSPDPNLGGTEQENRAEASCERKEETEATKKEEIENTENDAFDAFDAFDTAVSAAAKEPPEMEIELETSKQQPTTEPAPVQGVLETLAVPTKPSDLLELDLVEEEKPKDKETVLPPPKPEEPKLEPFSLANKAYVTFLNAQPDAQNVKKFKLNKLDVELPQTQVHITEPVKDHVSTSLKIELESSKLKPQQLQPVDLPKEDADDDVEILI